jgi:hypothetical protein
VASALLFVLLAPQAEARRPVIAHVDETTDRLALYDAELGSDLPAPALTIPNGRRFAVSFDGRYIAYGDAAKKLHLFDRATESEAPLPGIDIATDPIDLTVSNTGLIGFDDGGDGPAYVYSSVTRALIDTGLDPNNEHRQSHLSGDGNFLATTCVTGSAGCEVESGGSDADAFVQHLGTKQDTGFPDNLNTDTAGDDSEEHPCINGNGSLVGVDIGNPIQRDVFLYNRTTSTAVALPGLNSATEDDVNCVLDAAGDYVGVDDNAGNFKVYQRSTSSFISLPPGKITSRAWFSAPYIRPAPPGAGPGGAAPIDTANPLVLGLLVRPASFVALDRGPSVLSAARRGARVTYRLSEDATARFAVERAAPGRRVSRRCVAPNRRNRSRRRCTRHRRLRGSFSHPGKAGVNAFRFSGRLRGRRLRPGNYRLTIVATDAAGNRSAPRRSRFRIVRR